MSSRHALPRAGRLEVQRAVLGDAGLEAYKARAVTLGDYVGQTRSRKWGTMRSARSLTAIVGAEEARRWAGESRADLTRARWDQLPDEELIPAVVRSEVQPAERHLRRMGEYVAGRGFDAGSYERLNETITLGTERWERGEQIPTVLRHYLEHVGVNGEWPSGTTLDEYLASAREVVTSSDSGVMVSLRSGRWHVAFFGRLEKPEEYLGSDWVFVEYNVSRGFWRTAHRLWSNPSVLEKDRQRKEIRWLRHLPRA